MFVFMSRLSPLPQTPSPKPFTPAHTPPPDTHTTTHRRHHAHHYAHHPAHHHHTHRYQTLDVSALLKPGEANVFAVAGAHKGPWGPQTLVKVIITTAAAAATTTTTTTTGVSGDAHDDTEMMPQVLTVGTDASWLWRDADA